MLNIKKQICQGKRVGQMMFFIFIFFTILLSCHAKVSLAQEQDVSVASDTALSESNNNLDHNQYFETFDKLLINFNSFREKFFTVVKQSVLRLLNKIKDTFKRIWDSLFDLKKQKQEEISHEIKDKITEEINTETSKLKETAGNRIKNEINRGTSKIKEIGNTLQNFIYKIFSFGR